MNRPEATPEEPRVRDLACQLRECRGALEALLGHFGYSTPAIFSAWGTTTRPEAPGKSGERETRKAHHALSRRGLPPTTPTPPAVPRFHRGLLFFSCPACLRNTALYAKTAGSAARCPKCFSAIRAPHPDLGVPAENLEHGIEALLQPKTFQVTVPDGIPALSWRERLPRMSVALVKTAAVATVALLVAQVWILSFDADRAHRAGLSSASAQHPENAELRSRAVALVRSFIEADGIESKAHLVRDGESILPKMAGYYAARAQGAPHDIMRIGTRAGREEGGPRQSLGSTEVLVQFDNYETARFIVEHLPGSDLIEWESSVGYNPVDWRELAHLAPGEEEQRTFRVLARIGDYYARSFSRTSHLCIRLEDSEDGTFLAYAYAPKGTENAKELDTLLNGRRANRSTRLLVEVKVDSAFKTTRQVELTRLVKAGWRVDEGLLLTSSR